MLFNSLAFIPFFAVTYLVYYALVHRFRWAWLLAVSCYFYAAFIPAYLVILAALICLDYVLGLQIERRQGNARRLLLVVSICANIGALFVFKYFNFFNSNLASLAHLLHWNYSIENLRLALPIGLSFHVFQSLSYVIEVYRGKQTAERHFGIYALYVMFFPQLVAGPIERPQNLLPQFHAEHPFDPVRSLDGCKLILRGYLKKMVIADRLAILVDHVYANLATANGPTLALAVVAFSIQIYCDFSGYSDIALGLAELLGYRLMQNFNQPYLATSIPDFWRRWHISLSTWFRDYVYFPLGGNRSGAWKTCRNLLIIFLLSGLWHGASWTFVAWGALHGVYMVGSFLTRRVRERLTSRITSTWMRWLHRASQILLTNILVCIGWIFFRSNSFAEAWTILRRIGSDVPLFLHPLTAIVSTLRSDVLGLNPPFLAIALVAMVLTTGAQPFGLAASLRRRMAVPGWATVIGYELLVFFLLFFGYVGEKPFIYFQF